MQFEIKNPQYIYIYIYIYAVKENFTLSHYVQLRTRGFSYPSPLQALGHTDTYCSTQLLQLVFQTPPLHVLSPQGYQADFAKTKMGPFFLTQCFALFMEYNRYSINFIWNGITDFSSRSEANSYICGYIVLSGWACFPFL